MDDVIYNCYYNLHIHNERDIYKKIDGKVTHKYIKDWLSKQQSKQLQTNTNKAVYKHMIYQYPYQMCQCDLIDMTGYKQHYTFGLTFIDCFSRYLHIIPLKNKTQESVYDALKFIINDVKIKINTIQFDNGTEFKNKIVADLLKQNNINHRFSNPYESNSNGMIERANGTIKRMMFEYFQSNKTHDWVNALPKLLDSYNKYHNHRFTKFTPENSLKPENKQ